MGRAYGSSKSADWAIAKAAGSETESGIVRERAEAGAGDSAGCWSFTGVEGRGGGEGEGIDSQEGQKGDCEHSVLLEKLCTDDDDNA